MLLPFALILELFPSQQRLLWSQHSVCSSQMRAKQQLWCCSEAPRTGCASPAFCSLRSLSCGWDRRSLSPICLYWVWKNRMMQTWSFLPWFRTRAVQRGVTPSGTASANVTEAALPAPHSGATMSKAGELCSLLSCREDAKVVALILCITYCP